MISILSNIFDVPSLDYESIDVATAIKNIKTFYSTKGTSFRVAYLFKLLYGEDVSISYPKDQIIKPSSATWSVNKYNLQEHF